MGGGASGGLGLAAVDRAARRLHDLLDDGRELARSSDARGFALGLVGCLCRDNFRRLARAKADPSFHVDEENALRVAFFFDVFDEHSQLILDAALNYRAAAGRPPVSWSDPNGKITCPSAAAVEELMRECERLVPLGCLNAAAELGLKKWPLDSWDRNALGFALAAIQDGSPAERRAELLRRVTAACWVKPRERSNVLAYFDRVVELPALRECAGQVTDADLRRWKQLWEHVPVEKLRVELQLEFSGIRQRLPQAGPAPDAPTGFLGGAALADALGVHATRRGAFFRQLERERMSLEDGCWCEVGDPRPNSPRFLYRADSPKLRNLAAGYKTPKPA
jgi:hypothetical protein